MLHVDLWAGVDLSLIKAHLNGLDWALNAEVRGYFRKKGLTCFNSLLNNYEMISFEKVVNIFRFSKIAKYVNRCRYKLRNIKTMKTIKFSVLLFL